MINNDLLNRLVLMHRLCLLLLKFEEKNILTKKIEGKSEKKKKI